jgi:3-oxoacyl-[acyl-carrier protein] reductase
MSKLKGKVAVVTGASKGIGAAIAKSLAAEGASVVVNYASSKAGADKVVAAITAAGGKAVAVGGDVSKAADAQGLIAAAIKNYGRLDILVNNSGVYEFSPIDSFTEESFHKLFNVNVLGLLLTTQAAVKHLGEGSSIINIGSAVTRVTPANSSVYTGTKGAVDAITGVLSRELGSRKIRVNTLNPGIVETEGTVSAGFIGSDFEKSIVSQCRSVVVARSATSPRSRSFSRQTIPAGSPVSSWLQAVVCAKRPGASLSCHPEEAASFRLLRITDFGRLSGFLRRAVLAQTGRLGLHGYCQSTSGPAPFGLPAADSRLGEV